MKINIGKWLRRQVLGNKPVTIGNTLQEVAHQLGYDGPDWAAQIAMDLATGRVKAADIKARMDAQAQLVLANELRRVWAQLDNAILTLEGSRGYAA